MENWIKLRINAGDKSTGNAQDKAIADAYGNKFIIPFDFEMLDSAALYYQAGLRNRLCYELTFNDYNRVTKSRVSSPKVPDAKLKITDISLEYEIVTQPDLMRSVRSEYQQMALLYDRILRHRKIIVNKSDTVWCKLYDKRDAFGFHIVNFPFMSSNIPLAPAYGVYASQLVRYARCCSNYSDFLICHRALVKRLLSQGYKINRLSNTFKKFYGRHTDLVGQYKKNVCQMFADSIS